MKFCEVYNSKIQAFEKRLWQDLKVGDVVKLHSNEPFAADTLLLQSSRPNALCSIDTMQLDGETNLKEKKVPVYFKNKIELEIVCIEGYTICDYPSAELEKWDCNLLISGKSVLTELKNLILKGCILKNTDWVLGLLVYTGHDTKIMKNAKPPQQKISNVMNLMNKLLYSVFLALILLCIGFSAGNKYWSDKYGPDIWYIPQEVIQTNFFIQILTFLVSYSHLIPISLYVSLEIVKMVQSMLVYYDAKMEYTKPAIAKTSDLVEELGQVQIIFSDKTGTLTKNEMIFCKCSIDNVIVVTNSNESSKNNKETSKTHINEKCSSLTMKRHINPKINYDFFTCVTVCHNAYVDTNSITSGGKERKDKSLYMSSSPDEVALLEGAQQFNFVFINKTTDTVEIMDNMNKNQIYKIELEIPFDSIRKRMSVIVRNELTDTYYLFVKGADNEMIQALNKNINRNYLETAQAHLNKFGKEGLRTLVVAKKELNPEAVKDYVERFNQITLLTSNDKTEKMRKLVDEIESDLDYLGSTAIEDKLQDNVSDTISILLNCNIKIWVLTGDKKETALEIVKSCSLFQSDMNLIDLTVSNNQEDFETLIKTVSSQYKQVKERLFIIIDGRNLTYATENEEISNTFFSFAILAHSVVCCRVSPKQKARVVQLTCKNSNLLSLAVGDGANDVPMIMQANIGVGISGKEGTQAVRAADYALEQFQCLKRLILLHGRWGYIRIAIFICYYFYKNIILVCTEIYFSSFNGFSGQLFFPDLLPTMYNCFFTSWPCVIAYSIDKDVDEETTFKYPDLYLAGQKRFYFNLKIFWIWIFYAILHGVLTYFGIHLIYYFGVLNQTGIIHDHWTYATLSFSCLINDVTLKTFFDLRNWNFLSLATGLLSLVFYYFCLGILSTEALSFALQPELLSKFEVLAMNYKSMIAFLLFPFVTLLVDFSALIIQKNYFPTPVDLILMKKIGKKVDKQDESHQASKKY